MTDSAIEYRETRDIPLDKVLELYRANQWASARRPEELHRALIHSHSLVTAWTGERLVGLANAISDGYLVVYYPHLLVHPEHQRRGIGTQIMMRMASRYKGFHQQILVADSRAVPFYKRCGFEPAADTLSMWIYRNDGGRRS